MTPAQAAKQWLEVDAEARRLSKLRDEAADVLKAHFRESDKTSYRGVRYSATTITRFDQAKARELLGKRADECLVSAVRESLSAA